MFTYYLSFSYFESDHGGNFEFAQGKSYNNIELNYMITLMDNRFISKELQNKLFSLIGQQVKDPCVYTEIVDNKFIKISANYELPSSITN